MRSRRIFLATIVASSLFGTACLRDVGKTIGELQALRNALTNRFGDEVYVNLNGASQHLALTLTFINSALNDKSLQERATRAQAAANIVKTSYARAKNLEAIWVVFVRQKTTMVVFLLGCLILLGRRRWALAGACAALATLSWQPVFAVALAALAAAALLDQQATRRRIVLRFTVGGLVPSLATVVYFLGAGALSQAIGGFILINVEDTQQPSLLTRPRQIAAKEWSAYHCMRSSGLIS